MVGTRSAQEGHEQVSVHLKGGLQYCLESHFLLPGAEHWNLLGSSK